MNARFARLSFLFLLSSSLSFANSAAFVDQQAKQLVIDSYQQNCKALFCEKNQKLKFEISSPLQDPSLYLICDKNRIFIQPLGVLPKGTQTYHWGTSKSVLNMMGTGITAEEMTSLVDYPPSFPSTQGGGFYASLHSQDSRIYGPLRLTITAQEPLKIAFTPDLNQWHDLWACENESDDRIQKKVNKGLRDAGVHGVVAFSNFAVNPFMMKTHSKRLKKVLEDLKKDLMSLNSGVWFNFIHSDAISGILDLSFVDTKAPMPSGASIAWVTFPSQLKNFNAVQNPSDPLSSRLDIINTRYIEALTEIESHGIVPAYKIQDAIASRFIDIHGKSSMGLSRFSMMYPGKHPKEIYHPDSVWENWEKGADLVWNKCTSLTDYFSAAAQMDTYKLSIFYQTSFHQTPKLRTQAAYGCGHDNKAEALTRMQIETLTKESNGWIRWFPTLCDEETSDRGKNKAESETFRRNKRIEEKRFFKDLNGIEKQCGYFSYGPEEEEKIPREILSKIVQWIEFYNSKIKDVHHGFLNPIQFAAEVQKKLVSIHPFRDGNGRVSRLVMDCVLHSVGLPAPILEDMSGDIFSSSDDWAEAVGKGILESLKIYEECARHPNTPGCLSTYLPIRSTQDCLSDRRHDYPQDLLYRTFPFSED